MGCGVSSRRYAGEHASRNAAMNSNTTQHAARIVLPRPSPPIHRGGHIGNMQAESSSAAVDPFLRKNLAKLTFTDDEIKVVFVDFGMGEVVVLGAAGFSHFYFINDVDADCYVLLQGCKIGSRKHGEVFAQKLKCKIKDLAQKANYVIIEVKAGDDPEFKDEERTARLILDGCFEQAYVLSCDGDPAVHRREESLLHDIMMARGKEQEAKRLARDLRILRWNVSEIIDGEKILPFMNKNEYEVGDDVDSDTSSHQR
eukprot:TRINITY_DN51739_c0_g1_i1.p1 TRINITY_DN51739_c0_g1~~TRINITY_DN51739_c0_g1_i1.p1  ORF type:complete len:256 (-),score=47.62 TRINITY_DN51739_c0_g1_i1:24-791(-)